MFTIGTIIRKTVVQPLNNLNKSTHSYPFNTRQNRPGEIIRRYYSSIDFLKFIAEDALATSKQWTLSFIKRRKYTVASIGFCMTGYLVYRYKRGGNQPVYIPEETVAIKKEERVRNPVIDGDSCSYSLLAPFRKIGFFFASSLGSVRNFIDKMQQREEYDSTMSRLEYDAVVDNTPEILTLDVIEPSIRKTWKAIIPPSIYKKHLTLMIEVDLLFDVVFDREGFYMKRRPYADYLIKTLGKYAEIILVSSFHTKEAAKHYFRLIDPDHVTSYYFTREDMKIWHGRFVKPMEEDLSGRKPSRLVLLDNNLRECGPMCENVLQLKSWNGNVKDSSLKDIVPLLLYMATYVQNDGDVRDLTKQFVGVKDAAAKVKEIIKHGRDIDLGDEVVPKKLEVFDKFKEEEEVNV